MQKLEKCIQICWFEEAKTHVVISSVISSNHRYNNYTNTKVPTVLDGRKVTIKISRVPIKVKSHNKLGKGETIYLSMDY